MLSALRSEPRFPFDAPSEDLRIRSANFGIAMAARIPMIATTIMSSMSVKPGRRRYGVILIKEFALKTPLRQPFFTPRKLAEVLKRFDARVERRMARVEHRHQALAAAVD